MTAPYIRGNALRADPAITKLKAPDGATHIDIEGQFFDMPN